MDAIKSIARRTTQSIREKISHAESGGHDEKLEEANQKVRRFYKSSEILCAKIIRAAELMEELGNLMRDVGEEYRQIPDLQPVSCQFAEDIVSLGNMLLSTVPDRQKNLREHGFEVLKSFSKNTGKLVDAEGVRRKNQLEYDFFHKKVLDLRRNPPRDPSRIPRNEQTLENWRVELWKATENNKVICSQLYNEGQRAIDLSVLTLVNIFSGFVSDSDAGLKRILVNARLPQYPATPLLLSAPLPPNPMPPYQPPLQPGGYGQYPPWQQQQQPAFISQNLSNQPLPPPLHEQQQQQQQQQQDQHASVVRYTPQNGQEWASSAYSAPNNTTWPSGLNHEHQNGNTARTCAPDPAIAS